MQLDPPVWIRTTGHNLHTGQSRPNHHILVHNEQRDLQILPCGERLNTSSRNAGATNPCWTIYDRKLFGHEETLQKIYPDNGHEENIRFKRRNTITTGRCYDSHYPLSKQ
ncbi:hypothetical protein DPMN_053833 [Dreissena polymorpha]|uniref:Uncharacterized protein n=1 Tax=Dreissena polymorpha TaxID=45954 RepID=A0A9D4HP71_DREPO|nr:hypothetical protein DPMN_053833 [Dreissena polymorpha]